MDHNFCTFNLDMEEDDIWIQYAIRVAMGEPPRCDLVEPESCFPRERPDSLHLPGATGMQKATIMNKPATLPPAACRIKACAKAPLRVP
jgi:hypothetical protein